MKKLLFTAIALIMACCSLFAIGCKDDVKANDENSYVVSFYFLERHQDVSGKVVEEGFAFWKSCNVLKGQLLELDGYEQEYDYYKKENGTIVEAGEKGYFKPTDNATIYVKKRQKKTIRFFVNGENAIKSGNNRFIDTYEEEFSIHETPYQDFCEMSGLECKAETYIIKIDFYLASDYSGTPYASVRCIYENLNSYFSFEFIRSTDVYVKVSKI